MEGGNFECVIAKRNCGISCARSYRTLRDGSFGGCFSRHFVPGYDHLSLRDKSYSIESLAFAVGSAALDHIVPYGTVLSRGAFPGTLCLATIILSLRDKKPFANQRASPQVSAYGLCFLALPAVYPGPSPFALSYLYSDTLPIRRNLSYRSCRRVSTGFLVNCSR
jgi:hypothetical protein